MVLFFTRKLVNVSTLDEFTIVMNKCYSMQCYSKLDLLLIATRPVVENIHLSTKISRPREVSRNSAAETFYDGFTASKIRRLIRRAVIFPADFRRTNIRQRIRRSAAAEGSSLMSHWPCVTDFSGLSTYRLTAQTGR